MSYAKIPVFAYLVTVVGCAAVGGCAYLVYKVRTDNTVNIIGRHENPYPWLHTKKDENIKLYAVNNKFNVKGEYPTFVEGYNNKNL